MQAAFAGSDGDLARCHHYRHGPSVIYIPVRMLLLRLLLDAMKQCIWMVRQRQMQPTATAARRRRGGCIVDDWTLDSCRPCPVVRCAL